MVKVCLNCKKEFEIDECDRNQVRMLYCSEKCGEKYRRSRDKEARLHLVICSECGVEFETTRVNQSCCSDKCRHKRGLRKAYEYRRSARKQMREEPEKKEEVAPVPPAYEIEAEARKVGMNYGMYYALKQMEKERANRLRGTA